MSLKYRVIERFRDKYSRDEVEAAVAEYLKLYNFERINMENGLTQDEIRSKAA